MRMTSAEHQHVERQHPQHKHDKSAPHQRTCKTFYTVHGIPLYLYVFITTTNWLINRSRKIRPKIPSSCATDSPCCNDDYRHSHVAVAACIAARVRAADLVDDAAAESLVASVPRQLVNAQSAYPIHRDPARRRGIAGNSRSRRPDDRSCSD